MNLYIYTCPTPENFSQFWFQSRTHGYKKINNWSWGHLAQQLKSIRFVYEFKWNASGCIMITVILQPPLIYYGIFSGHLVVTSWASRLWNSVVHTSEILCCTITLAKIYWNIDLVSLSDPGVLSYLKSKYRTWIMDIHYLDINLVLF